MAKALKTPLKWLWVDHVPTGAEIAAMNLGLRRDRQPLPIGLPVWSGRCGIIVANSTPSG